MPKLPDISDLGPAPVADRARPVADYSAGGQALARGAEALGQGIEKAGAGLGDLATAENHWDYAKANSYFHTSLIDQEDKTKQDKTYGPDDSGKSLVNRHAESIWDLRDKAAEMIREPRMREMFMTRSAPTIARSIEGARTHATALEHQASDAYSIQAGQDLIDKAPNAADEATRRDAIDSQNLLIEGLKTKGVITPVQEVERKKQFAEHYAVGAWLGHAERNPLEARQQLENPDQKSIYSIIPIETRLKLIDHAKAKVGAQAAQETITAVSNDAGVPLTQSSGGGVQPVINKPVQQATEGIISAIDPDTGKDIAPEINAAGENAKKNAATPPSGGALQPAIVGTPATAASLKSSAYARIMNNPKLNWQERQVALRDVSQAIQASEIAAGATARERSEASNNAAGGYATEMWSMAHSPDKDWMGLSARINHDENLEWRTKDALLDRLTRLSGGDEEISFGPGYLAAREALFSSASDPLHASLADIAKRRDVTERGLHDLSTRWSLANKDLDRHSIEQRATDYLKYAYSKLSFEEDTGFFKLRDPKGQAIYYSQFAPDFTKELSEKIEAAAGSGDRTKLNEFLSRENVDTMIRNYRDPKQMAADRVLATGETVANEPVPPAPKGYNESGWNALMRNPPVPDRAKWSQALQTLAKKPTSEMQAAFDRAYGVHGYTAKDVLKKLGHERTLSDLVE